MKLFWTAFIVGIICAWPVGARAATCTATGFYKDNTNLTAAVINPTGTFAESVDATGCDIGVYYGPGASGSVYGAAVYNAKYFGILVAGDCGYGITACTPGATSVDVKNSTVTNIGDSPFDGAQHGDAIAYYDFNAAGSATGTASGNNVSNYQKGGIVALGPGASASISDNTVKGLGPVDFIAQNGIEIDYGATGQVMRNTVTGNSYTGSSASSSGILVFGGCGYALGTGIQVVKNIVGGTAPEDGNDIGIGLVNLDATCSVAPSSATNDKAINNTITNEEKTNGYVYQVGISECGVNDKLIHNTISGDGYTGTISSGMGYAPIDTDDCTTAAKIHANRTP